MVVADAMLILVFIGVMRVIALKYKWGYDGLMTASTVLLVDQQLRVEAWRHLGDIRLARMLTTGGQR